MKRTTKTYFRNPGTDAPSGTGRAGSSTQSARPASAVDAPLTGPMDTGKKAVKLAKQGGGIVGGQVAATVLTNYALQLGGQATAPGTLGRKAVAIGLPMVIGAGVLGFSKQPVVQMAGFGCLSSGVAAALDIVLQDARPQLYAGDVGGRNYADALPGGDAGGGQEQLAGAYDPVQLLPEASYQAPAEIVLVDAKDL